MIASYSQATSISVLAWLHDEAYTVNAVRALKWIASQCKGGRFGSTQATVLALKAIIAFDSTQAQPSGSVSVSVDGSVVDTVMVTSQGTVNLNLSSVSCALAEHGTQFGILFKRVGCTD